MSLVVLFHVKNATGDTFSKALVCFVGLARSPQYQRFLREDGMFQTGERFVDRCSLVEL